MRTQLQNNFRCLAVVTALSLTSIGLSGLAYAEDVSAEFVTTDWLIFVKSENSELTELSRHMQGPAMIAAANTALNLDPNANNFEQNYLYILVGNRLDGLEPYLAGKLIGSKSVVTGDSHITVMESNFKDINPPTSITLIQEIIEGGFGGGSYVATAPIGIGEAQKPVNGDILAATWSTGQKENSAVNVFRIPYSAILNPSSGDSRENGNEGITVNVDVGGLLGSIFGNEDKDAIDGTPETINDDTSSASGQTATDNSTAQIADNPNSETTVEPIIIEPDPIVITEYVQDPDLLKDRNRLLDEREDMVEYIGGLTEVIKAKENTIRELNSDLAKKTNAATSTLALLQERDATIITMQSEIDKKVPPTPGPEKAFPIVPVALAGLGLLGLGGFLGFLVGRRKKSERTPLPLLPPRLLSKDNVERGMVFAPSQMMVGGSALPLNLAAIKPVYDAVGRIGFAQQGKPVGKDESFGTGILISERHILTNRHVWEMFKHRLISDEPTGIEFYGEKKSDKSDFVTFGDVEPVCIDGWDAAIFTLSRAPDNRRPVTITPRPAEQLNDLDIVVVGYPQAHRMTDDIAQVTEKDPVFGVKRFSEGKIFRHSADIENPYGVEAAVESIINPTEAMRAVCHNASTLGGSSGSAVICKKTGDLVALHFGFDSAYEWEEPANFAVAGEDLADKVANIIKPVIQVTDTNAALS